MSLERKLEPWSPSLEKVPNKVVGVSSLQRHSLCISASIIHQSENESVASFCPRQGSYYAIDTLANGSDIIGRGMSGALQLGFIAAL